MHYLEASQGHVQTNAFPSQKPVTQKESLPWENVSKYMSAGPGCPVLGLLRVEAARQGCWGCGRRVVPGMEDKVLPCGFIPSVRHRWLPAGQGTMPAGYSGAGPPPTTAFALFPMDQLCWENSGLYVGQAHRWLQHCREGIKMNKDPPFSLHPAPPDAQPLAEGSFGSRPKEEERFFEALGSFEQSQRVCGSWTSTEAVPRTMSPVQWTDPAMSSPFVCARGELCAARGMGDMTQFMGSPSIRLALLPLGFVEGRGPNQLPEQGDFSAAAQRSIAGAGWAAPGGREGDTPPRGCSPACVSPGGEQISE